MALKCLNDCITYHKHCPKPDTRTNLPTRIIDCKNPSRPRLIISMGASAPYVALSYVWGTNHSVKLTTGNEHELHQEGGLAPSTLPATLQDAIALTKGLGIPFIWIDTFCILQDDMNDISVFGTWLANQEVVRFDVTIDKVLLVNRLNTRDLEP